ncbi:MAG: hypothetical protein SFU56_17160 [Capsulimonadales bacterium]|nr:hypothetical protein [Capsulimonadales bacterium]
MTEIEAEKAVTQLNRLRQQAQWWRIGTAVVLVGGTIASIASISTAVNGLTRPGPRQDIFTREISNGLQERVLPQVRTIAQQTIAETRPQVEKEFARAGERLPEVTEAAVNELQMLERNVTASGEKAISATLMPVLEKKEQKIRTMFPEATEENVRAVMTTLKDETEQRAVTIADRLFDRHLTSLNNIVTSIETIRMSEKPVADDEAAGWEMGLAALDVVRDELREMVPDPATNNPPGPGSQTRVADSRRKEAQR